MLLFKKSEIILFPLFYSLAFCKDIKSSLKSDIISIIELLREFYSEDKIFFKILDIKNINLEFLSEINQLIYRMKIKMKKEKVLPLFKNV